MKILSVFSILLILASSVQAIRQLPSYLPSAPDVNKAVADYTVADVMGVVCTSQKKLPVGHPYAGNKSKKDLKTEWPGSAIASNIDQFLSYLTLTPNAQDEKTVRGNVYWILHEIMNVSDAEKVAAILRTHTAQTDVAKKRKIVLFAAESFSYLMDVDMLILIRNLLDDGLVLSIARPEGRTPREVTVRGEVQRMCRGFILDKNALNITMVVADYQYIYKNSTSEEQSCQRMKQWMIDNWALISTKATTAKTNQNRPYKDPFLRVFDPRP